MECRNPLVFILDDEESILQQTEKSLSENIDCTIKVFQDYKNLINDEDLENVDLFIVDVFLAQEQDGRELCGELTKLNPTAPILFMSDNDIEKASFKAFNCNLYDFISKPLPLKVFLNRVEVLLKVSQKYRCLQDKKEYAEKLLWELFNYCNFYIVVLDPDFKIKLANYALAVTLGFENESEIQGKNWLDFIPESQKRVIQFVCDEVCKGKQLYEEYTSEIISSNGEYMYVQWFSSYIDNNIQCTFNIGIPILENKNPKLDSADSVRAFYKDVLERDRKNLEIIKQSLGLTINS